MNNNESTDMIITNHLWWEKYQNVWKVYMEKVSSMGDFITVASCVLCKFER